MSVNLMAASRQWANRPPDERFWTIEDLEGYLNAVKARSIEGRAGIHRFRAVVENDNLLIAGREHNAEITNYALGQLCQRVDFPASPLQKLSAKLAAEVINERIEAMAVEDEVQLLVEQGEKFRIRSVTSDRYARIWSADLIPFLKHLQSNGWKVPPARPAMENQPGTRVATEKDILSNQGEFGLSVNVGDSIAPAGLYAGDRDMFAFMVNTDNQVDDGTGRKLSRFAIMTNSEVGAGSLSLTEGLMMNVCGNHILWGVSNIIQLRYRHIGEVAERAAEALELAKSRLSNWQDVNIGDKMNLLRGHTIAPDKDVVVECVYKLRLDPSLTQKALKAGYEAGEVYGEIDGAAPNTPLGLVHGITRYSQTINNANERMKVDLAAGKIMDHFSKALA